MEGTEEQNFSFFRGIIDRHAYTSGVLRYFLWVDYVCEVKTIRTT